MKPIFLLSLLFGVVAATTATAADGGGVPKVSSLALGGAAPSTDGTSLVGWGGGNLLAGVSPVASRAFSGQSSKGMQMGGFLAWQAEDYRVDATLAPSLDGSIIAGVGAAVGAKPGQIGTSYGLRLGAALLGDRFTVNPATGLALSEVVTPSSDVNLTFTVNHALTPSLSVIGTAEARRPVGSTPLDGAATMQGHFLFGAGLGYRF
jgi:hypothetical protein